ncbi:MAG TPA: alpha/beta hydrolase [Hyphomicrobiaceae bacterium]|nr:alpha/beta hydrolase [Hyphomicrobiaceae bacterium]
MPAVADLFPGFAEHRVKTDGVEIFVRSAGSGPPLLLLHGYPQTHVCWHRIAGTLARHVTVVLADLRGYGASSVPEGDARHAAYSKRAMAEDCVAVMRTLGHRRFMVGGHDRGGRVAYRLALDHPDTASALIAVDIMPTAEMWRRITAERAIGGYHWQFLAQPAPLPETLIGHAPDYYLEHTLKSWAGPRDLSVFSAEALRHYRALMRDPARVHAMCEDYRAGATIDRQLDEADMTAGRKISCPTLVLWGTEYLGRGATDPLDVWRAWCTSVTGQPIASGHFLAEENPEATLAALLPFLAACR